MPETYKEKAARATEIQKTLGTRVLQWKTIADHRLECLKTLANTVQGTGASLVALANTVGVAIPPGITTNEYSVLSGKDVGKVLDNAHEIQTWALRLSTIGASEITALTEATDSSLAYLSSLLEITTVEDEALIADSDGLSLEEMGAYSRGDTAGELVPPVTPFSALPTDTTSDSDTSTESPNATKGKSAGRARPSQVKPRGFMTRHR